MLLKFKNIKQEQRKLIASQFLNLSKTNEERRFVWKLQFYYVYKFLFHSKWRNVEKQFQANDDHSSQLSFRPLEMSFKSFDQKNLIWVNFQVKF